MKKIVIITLCYIGFLFCSPSSPNKNCEFSYNKEKTQLEWTAYKFTKMVGVKGGFKNVEVSGVKKASSIEEVFKDLKFSIDTSSVNTNNPERDGKIAASFFGKMSSNTITGEFRNIASGKATLSLTMNGKTKDSPVTYTIQEESKIEVNGKINVFDWEAKDSLESLNTVCSEQHKGEDGSSKLWPDVAIKITSQLDMVCK